MGKNTRTTKYEPVVHLLLIAGAILITPLLAFNFVDLELFSVSKTTFITLFSSIKPWLCPPYVYLLINFIIFFIVASSSLRSSNTTVFNPRTTDDDGHHQSLVNDSLICQSLEAGLEDQFNFHTLDGKIDNEPVIVERSKEVASERLSAVDKRELRKSKTFHEGVSRPKDRRERYVRILSQEELDRQVKAFICRFKKQTNVQ